MIWTALRTVGLLQGSALHPQRAQPFEPINLWGPGAKSLAGVGGAHIIPLGIFGFLRILRLLNRKKGGLGFTPGGFGRQSNTLAATLLVALLAATPAYALDDTHLRDAYGRSFGYEHVQRYGDAIRALVPVFDAYPDGYTVNLRLGWLKYLSGQFAGAVDHYRKAAQVAPAAIEARLGLVDVLLAQDRLDEAAQAAWQVVAVDRFNHTANLRLAGILRRQGKAAQSERVAGEMLALYPTSVPFMVEQALARSAQGEDEAAAAIFAQVRVLDPENIEAVRFSARQGGR